MAVNGKTLGEVLSLPGCVSQGTSRDQALTNVREAISLNEDVLRGRGEPVDCCPVGTKCL